MLTIRLLGSLQLEIDGEPIGSFRSSKALALFIYLVHTGQPHPREALADLLWEAGSTRQALSNLRTVLTQLRPKLGDYLLSEGSTLAFNQAEPFWLDTAVLQTELTASPQQLTPLSATRLETALQNYQGDFLENFLVRNAEQFNEWLLIEQERLRQRVLSATQRLALFFLAQQDFAATIRSANRWLAIEPLDELAHRTLMQALALAGQRSAALQQYETCYTLLTTELGLEPEEATQHLAAQIQTGQLTTPLTAESASPTSPSQTIAVPANAAAPHNLQFTPFTFFGRLPEQNTLVNQLQDKSVRLVTVTGVGGMGKTRLALVTAVHLLTNHTDQLPDGIFFLSLTALDSTSQLATALADVLNIPLKPEVEQPVLRQMTAVLQTKKLLLILDNLEHLLDHGGRAFVQAVLQETPNLKLLITSREPLEVDGETILALDGLTLPPDTAVALNAPAAQLFQQAARRVQPSFTLAPADAPALRQLCHWLMGLPLALELAGAWADTLSLPEMVAEIEQNVDFLEALRAEIPDRQRSLRAVFNTTWARLSSAEQTLWPQLALFRDGFTFAAAQVALHASRPLLARLVKKSLLRFDHDQERYVLHPLLQQFGLSQLSSTATEQTKAAIAGYFCTWLAEQLPNLQGGAQQATAVALIADWQNCRQAWYFAAAQGQLDWLAAAAEPFNHFCLWRGAYLEAIEAIAAGLTAIAALETAVALRLQARLLIWTAVHAYELGQRQQQRDLLAEAAAVLQHPALPPETAKFEWAFLQREQAKSWRKTEPDRALAAYAESRRLFHELGETWQESLSLAWMGDIAGRRHDWPQLAQLTQELLALQEQMGDARGKAFSLVRLSALAQRQGQLAEAEKLIRQTLAIVEPMGETRLVSQALHSLGTILLRGGQFAAAEAALQESYGLVQDVNQDHVLIKNNLHMLGFAALWQRDFGAAERFMRRALAAGEQHEITTTVADSLGFLGEVQLWQGQLENAKEQLMTAVSPGGEAKRRNEHRWANMLGVALLHLGEFAEAAKWGEITREPWDACLLQVGLLAVGERPLPERQNLLKEQVIIARQQGSRPNFPDLAYTLGLAAVSAAHLGLVEDGWTWGCEVLQEALDTRQWPLLLYGLSATARLQTLAGELAEAIQLLAWCETFSLIKQSAWFGIVLREPVTEATQKLPARQRAGLRLAGKRLDGWKTAVQLLES